MTEAVLAASRLSVRQLITTGATAKGLHDQYGRSCSGCGGKCFIDTPSSEN